MDGECGYRSSWNTSEKTKKEDEGRKSSIMFSVIMKQQQEAKNDTLSGKNACRKRGNTALS